MGADEDSPAIAADQLARQELSEEAGLHAGSLQRIGEAFLAYGLSNHGFGVFVATDLSTTEPGRSVEEQGMTTRHVEREEFEQLVLSGRIKDSATLSAYALLMMREQRGEVRIGSTRGRTTETGRAPTRRG